jgi:hypothetical protein
VDIRATWGHLGYSEPYMVPSQQSTYVHAISHAWKGLEPVQECNRPILPEPSDQGWDVPKNTFKHLFFLHTPSRHPTGGLVTAVGFPVFIYPAHQTPKVVSFLPR